MIPNRDDCNLQTYITVVNDQNGSWAEPFRYGNKDCIGHQIRFAFAAGQPSSLPDRLAVWKFHEAAVR